MSSSITCSNRRDGQQIATTTVYYFINIYLFIREYSSFNNSQSSKKERNHIISMVVWYPTQQGGYLNAIRYSIYRYGGVGVRSLFLLYHIKIIIRCSLLLFSVVLVLALVYHNVLVGNIRITIVPVSLLLFFHLSIYC